MKTPAGKECRYYYEDYFRGNDLQECRLIGRNRRSERWEPRLCAGCPVPDILRANSSPHLALEARVVRRWRFWKHVHVEAYCTRHLIEIPEPHVGCVQCRQEMESRSILNLPVAPDEDAAGEE
jgi:hypothetical protein